jgi:hypothetical protein
MLGWVAFPFWIANIFLLMGLLRLRRDRRTAALVFGILAIGASASMMLSSAPGQLRIGYYLWTSSMAVFAIGALLFYVRGKGIIASGKPEGGWERLEPENFDSDPAG